MKQALIYNELVRYYNRSRRKLQSLAVEGKNLRKQSILQRRIVRLFKSLTRLQRALKLGMGAAALSAGILLFQPCVAEAQAEITFGAAQMNPFGLTDIGLGQFLAPAFTDLDGDGDMDLMVGDTGGFFYFENTGTAAAPDFGAAQFNPFGLTDSVGYYPDPAFADLDGDGDMDMMGGEFYGNFFYFQNTGTSAAPAFAAAQTNPFGLTDIGEYATPAFADLDGDGDMDLMALDFFYFQNTGTVAAPAFAAPQTNPFGLMNIGFNPAPVFADLDVDGDMDMMAGEYDGDFFYFQNTGTTIAPAFVAAQINPFGLTDIGYQSSPTFADLDADGDMDMLAGEFYGDFFYFENTTSCSDLTAFADADGDSYGDIANGLLVEDCIVPGGYVIDSTDCNDANTSVHPGATEVCNSMDDNCDGVIDEGCAGICVFPTGLTTSDITSSSAKLNWDEAAGAAGYKVHYKVYGANDRTTKASLHTFKNINGLSANTTYIWQVRTYCEIDSPHVMSNWSPNQTFTTGSLRADDESLQQISFQIYPNPAEDQATIQFTLLQSSNVYLKVYDVSGREIATLLSDDLQQGEHSLQLNTHHFSKGVYLVKMISDSGIENQKLIVQ